MNRLFSKYKFILLGAFLFGTYFWVKFIRERMPKDIPFTNSLVGILILVEICCIYGYVLYILFKKNHKASLLSIEFITLLYHPLILFDTYIKNISWIKHYHKNFIIAFVYGCEYMFKNTALFYIIFGILPRIILVTALVIDTFIYGKLYYFYNVLLIGILLFLHRYIIYSLKYAKKSFIDKYTPYLSQGYILTPSIFGFRKSTWVDTEEEAVEYKKEEKENEDEYEDEEYVPNTLMAVPLNIFVNFQTSSIIYTNIIIKIRMITFSETYLKKIENKYSIPFIPLEMSVDSTAVYDKKKENLEYKINDIVQISLLLKYYYNIIIKTKYINLIRIISVLYFICWSTILYKSLQIFKYNNITDDMLFQSLQKILEPFTGILL